MGMVSKNIEVLIVGAGPSGLMVAAQLLRHGVHPTIIDQRIGPDKSSKALVLQARTMELLRQMGVDEQLMRKGMACEGIQLQEGKAVWGHTDFDVADEPRSRFPTLLTISQNHVEGALTQLLTENTCAIRWNTRLLSFRQNDREAIVEVGNEDSKETWRCNWVIGADGSDSRVRELAGISVAEHGPEIPMLLAEMQLEEGRNRRIHLFLSKERQFLALLPMGNEGNYRLIGSLPPAVSEAGITYAGIKSWVDRILGFELPVARYRWGKVVHSRRRAAGTLRQQRCFLVGDAAHEFPYGLGFGLNIGMQEAVNLSWKLAGVIRGRHKPDTLYSYGQEREWASQQAMSLADMLWRAVLDKSWITYSWLWGRFRKRMTRILARPETAGKIEADMAQLDVDYQASTLSVHHSTQFGVRAGDRLPYLSLFDEKQKAETDLHAWCAKPGFVLLVLGTVSHHNLRIMSQWMKQKFPRDMHLYYLPYSDTNKAVFDRFGMRKTMTKMVLVRPDMHIAYINDTLNTGLVDIYMEEVMGWSYEPSIYGNNPRDTTGE